jgi:hypothetical protein
MAAVTMINHPTAVQVRTWSGNSHAEACSKSFTLLPYETMKSAILIPALSFAFMMSVLLRNRIKFVSLRCLFDTTDVHRLTESSWVKYYFIFCYVQSPRLDPLDLQAYSPLGLQRELDQSNLETVLSPWGPLIDVTHLMGARNMMASMSSK